MRNISKHRVVQCQDIVCRPGTAGNRDIIQDDRLHEADLVINVRLLLDEMLEEGLIVKGWRPIGVVVVSGIVGGLCIDVLFAAELEGRSL